MLIALPSNDSVQEPGGHTQLAARRSGSASVVTVAVAAYAGRVTASGTTAGIASRASERQPRARQLA